MDRRSPKSLVKDLANGLYDEYEEYGEEESWDGALSILNLKLDVSVYHKNTDFAKECNYNYEFVNYLFRRIFMVHFDPHRSP